MSPLIEKTPKGKFVTRSVYQKVCEENKRLLADIRAMVVADNPDVSLATIYKWQKKFYEESKLNQELRIVAKQYLKEHPEYDIMSPDFKLPTK